MEQYRDQMLWVDRLCAIPRELRAEFTVKEDKLASTISNVNLQYSKPIERVDRDAVQQFDRFVAENGGLTGTRNDEIH